MISAFSFCPFQISHTSGTVRFPWVAKLNSTCGQWSCCHDAGSGALQLLFWPFCGWIFVLGNLVRHDPTAIVYSIGKVILSNPVAPSSYDVELIQLRCLAIIRSLNEGVKPNPVAWLLFHGRLGLALFKINLFFCTFLQTFYCNISY